MLILLLKSRGAQASKSKTDGDLSYVVKQGLNKLVEHIRLTNSHRHEGEE